MGIVGGLLVIAATVLITLRCVVRHRTRPEPGFEVDMAWEEVTPFFSRGAGSDGGSDVAVAGHAGARRQKRKGAGLFSPRWAVPTASESSGYPMSLLVPHNPGEEPSAGKFGHSPAATASSSQYTSDDLSAGPSGRRAIQEEDAEDAELDVVPPAYREAWAERHQMQLHDGAVGVTRVEEGRRAVDSTAAGSAAACPMERAAPEA